MSRSSSLVEYGGLEKCLIESMYYGYSASSKVRLVPFYSLFFVVVKVHAHAHREIHILHTGGRRNGKGKLVCNFSKRMKNERSIEIR